MAVTAPTRLTADEFVALPRDLKHAVVSDFGDGRRVVQRVTLRGDRPLRGA